MRLFVDVDGVVLDFERSFVGWLNRTLGLALPEDYRTSHWNFTEVLAPEQLSRSWWGYLDSEEAGRIPPLVDPERFNALHRDHEVHLLTNFPQRHLEKRLRNLHGLGFRYRSLQCCGLHIMDMDPPLSKAEAINRLHSGAEPALFIDDHPDNCLDVAIHCTEVEVWIMTHRYNSEFSHPAVRRAEDWDAFLARIAAYSANGSGRARL